MDYVQGARPGNDRHFAHGFEHLTECVKYRIGMNEAQCRQQNWTIHSLEVLKGFHWVIRPLHWANLLD